MNDGIIIEVGMIHKLKELGVTNAAVIMLYGKILTMSEDTGYCTARKALIRPYRRKLIKLDIQFLMR